MNKARTISQWLLGIFFIVAGFYHFHIPAAYLQIMPPALPAPLLLIYISGAAEIAGGMGVLLPFFRKVAGWGLILLLIAVFPANIYAVHGGMIISHYVVPYWMLLLRLPFQPLLIFWVYWSCLQRSQQNFLFPSK